MTRKLTLIYKFLKLQVIQTQVLQKFDKMPLLYLDASPIDSWPIQ